MKLLKKLLIICTVLSISVGFINAKVTEVSFNEALKILEQQLRSDIRTLINDTDNKLQDLSRETEGNFYVEVKALNKEVKNISDYLNNRYVDLAGGKYSIGGTTHTKPGVYKRALMVFDGKSDQIIKDTITSFDNLPSIEAILKMNYEGYSESISSAREELLSTLLDIKENIYINLLNAKDRLLQDIGSYIRNLIASHQAEQAVVLGAPVVYTEEMVEKSFTDKVGQLTTGWWKAFKSEAFESHIDPKTGKCLTAKNPFAEKGEENLFNITPLSTQATKTTVCRSIIDQLNATGENITKNVTTKVVEGAKNVTAAAQQAAAEAIVELPGKAVEKAKDVAGQVKEKVTAPKEEKPKAEPKPTPKPKPSEPQEKPKEKTVEEAQASQDVITLNMNLLKEILKSEPNLEEIQTLIDQGADSNLKDGKGDPILVYAAQEFKLPVIKLLIEKGVNINATNTNGENALNAVARSYLNQFQRSDSLKKLTLDIVNTLIQAKINIDNQTKDGTTALMSFATADATDVVKKLLQLGANRDLKNSQGKTAIDLAKEGSLTQQYLIIGKDIK